MVREFPVLGLSKINIKRKNWFSLDAKATLIWFKSSSVAKKKYSWHELARLMEAAPKKYFLSERVKLVKLKTSNWVDWMTSTR